MSASVITCERIRKGQPATAEITVSLQDDGTGLPSLYLFSDWSDRLTDWRTRDRYDVEEIPAADGRAFLLWRSAEALARDPEGDVRYGVFIARNGQDHLCECRGHAAHAAHAHCKHVDSIRGLIEAGHIDHPLCRPADPVQLPEGEPAPF